MVRRAQGSREKTALTDLVVEEGKWAARRVLRVCGRDWQDARGCSRWREHAWADCQRDGAMASLLFLVCCHPSQAETARAQRCNNRG